MKVLHLDSSILGEASVSRQLTREVVQRLRKDEANMEVTHRELGAEPVAHLTGELLATRGTTAELLNELQRREARFDDELVSELASADVIVIGAPLYNFTVPTGLKAWIDRIAVAGRTFRYTGKGSQGLMTGKRAIIVATSGGSYADSPVDHMHVGYVKQVLNFIGITDIDVVRAPGLALGAEVREHSIADARNRIDALFAAEIA